jgi:hypothetical protein
MSEFNSPVAGQPSASGVRRGGDDFQDIMVWTSAMQLLRPRTPFTLLEVERAGVGNFDDVILRSNTQADRLSQVKWCTHSGALLDEAYLTKARERGTSVLSKMFQSFLLLRADAPELSLITNRAPDPSHGLLGHIDGRTDLLMPAASVGSPRTGAGRALAAWVQHVQGSRDDVLAMLEHLRFLTGQSRTSALDRMQLMMETGGLRTDQAAIDSAMAITSGWVVGGRRTVTPDDVSTAVRGRDLIDHGNRALLLVQAIDWDHHPEDATEALDWVDHFEGDSPRNRRRPIHDDAWQHMQRDLDASLRRMEANGLTHILLRGYMRQAIFFAVGALAPKTRGWSIAYTPGAAGPGSIRWDTDAAASKFKPAVSTAAIARDNDLGVVISTATDATHDVASYLRREMPVGKLLSISPDGGPDDQAIQTPGQAIGFTQACVQAVRQHLGSVPANGTIHLFLAGPGGLAMLLGHRWNGMRPTTVYEHLGAGLGYMPTFHLP